MAQQYMSPQLLLFKYRKLFYLLSFNNDNIVKHIRDVLTFTDKVRYSTQLDVLEQPIGFVFQQINDIQNGKIPYSLIPNRIQYFSDPINLEQIVYCGCEQKDAQIVTFEQDFNVESIVDKITQDDIFTITFDDNFIFLDERRYSDYFNDYHSNSFQLNESIIKTQKEFTQQQYQQYSNSYIEYNNYIQFFSDNFIFELYLDNQFIGNTVGLLFYDKFDKVLIDDFIGGKKIYLKIFDKDRCLIKTILLRKSVQFNLLVINNGSYQVDINSQRKHGIQFFSNYFTLNGYNIYHSNQICNIYYSNFSNEKKLFSNYIENHIISGDYINQDNFLIMNKNSTVILRFDFNKVVYVKKLLLNTNKLNTKYDLFVRYANLNQLGNKNFRKIYFDGQSNLTNYSNGVNYNGGFYCQCLDLKIKYYGYEQLQIDEILFYVYDIDVYGKHCSDYVEFGNNDNIIINVQNAICQQSSQKSCFSKYYYQYNGENYFCLIPKNLQRQQINQCGILLNNVVSNDSLFKDGFFSTKNTFNNASLQFTLSKNALSDKLVNPFSWLYVQCKKQLTQNTSYIDLKYFSVHDNRYNYPRVLIYQTGVGNSNVGVFIHIDPIFDSNIGGYIQKWCFSYLLKGNGIGYFSNNDYISFVYKKQQIVYNGNVTYEWNVYAQIVLNGNIVQNGSVTGYTSFFEQNQISFIDNSSKKGFKIGDYIFKSIDKKNAGYKIQAKISNSETYLTLYQSTQNIEQFISCNLQSYSFGNNNIDVKITFWDGDDEKFKLYSVLLLNYNYQNGVKFLQQNTQDIKFEDNGITQNDKIVVHDNYYHTLYSVNHINNAPTTGIILQDDTVFFNNNAFVDFNKNNLHFYWQKNKLFQYLVMFSDYTTQKYKNRFLPFEKYFTEANCNLISDTYIGFNKVVKQFSYNCNQIKIFVGVSITEEQLFSEYIKFDYFIQYSQDGILWSNQIYYKPFRLFYAKYVKVKCIINTEDSQYYDNLSVCLKFVDSKDYYLTQNDYFDSISLRQLYPNTQYIFMLYKYYNQQFVTSKVNLLKSENNIIEKKQQLQLLVDLVQKNNEYLIAGQQNDSIYKLSGLDQKINIYIVNNQDLNSSCKFVFNIYLVVQQQYIKIDKIQLDYNQLYSQNQYLFFNYSFKEDYFNTKNIFAVDAFYFDENYNVSEYSQKINFVFNNIPHTPIGLDILNGE